MQQSYWHLTGNLWALALSTVIALFLPEFGPKDIMSGGVGVVIRTTMVAPVVFSLLYFAGQLISFLTRRIKVLGILMAGIERGIRREAERLSKDARQRAEEAERRAEAAEQSAKASELEQEQVIQFMRSKGVSDEDIDAFFRRESSYD